jgi:hypothetical protein
MRQGHSFSLHLQANREMSPAKSSVVSNRIRRIGPLLSKALETNNKKTAVAMQQRDKHASTTTELLLETVLCNPLLGS